MLNVAFSNESLWFSDFMPREPLLWIIHWQIKHEFCCFVFLSTLTRPEFTIWVQANLKTSEKEGGRCRRRWRNSPSNPGWVSERVRDRAGADELKIERDWARMSSSSMQAVLPARQSFYEFPFTLSLSLCSHVHRTHSFLLSGHCRERTDRNHHGIGIRPGKRGKIKPLLSSSLFFPRLFFSSALFCLFASSPSPSMSLNSFWRDWIKEKWGL